MRRPFKELPSFEERVTASAQQALQAAEALSAGPEKDELLKKAHKTQAARNIAAWANSPNVHSTQ
jgi:hypothetical protein